MVLVYLVVHVDGARVWLKWAFIPPTERVEFGVEVSQLRCRHPISRDCPQLPVYRLPLPKRILSG